MSTYLGQNFLRDKKVISKIIKISNIDTKDTVLEIGPGNGILTYKLISKCNKLICIERDPSLSKILINKFQSYNNIEIINNDYLNTSLTFHVKSPKVISSLPYYKAKQILSKLLLYDDWFNEGYFIIQKEVADSYSSNIPNCDYLARIIHLFGNMTKYFDIYPVSFSPKPKVMSTFISINKEDEKYNLLSNNEKIDFLSFLRDLYRYKRKTLNNSLKQTIKYNKLNISIDYFNNFSDIFNKRVEEVDTLKLINLWKQYKSFT